MTTSIVANSQDSHKQLNIETRIANRSKSIFAAIGTTINDFYLEAGIYFVGGFNAMLVSWDIYTSLLADNQPMFYAVILAIVAFIAVEGLAVYLVGAAAKTNNGLLWFFSVMFAVFFTYAHYQDMHNDTSIITEYITLAIPFFVVVGYWARTLKIDTESEQQKHELDHINELKRLQQIEDEKRRFEQRLQLAKMDKSHQLKLAKINRNFTGKQPEILDRKNGQNSGNSILPEINLDRKLKKAEILDQLPGLVGQGLTNVQIGEIVGRNERTIRDYRKELNGQVS